VDSAPRRFFYDILNKLTILLFCSVLLLLNSCASIDGIVNAEKLSSGAQMIRHDVTTDMFTLTTFSRITNPDLPLHVYIEGDGRAWIDRSQVSTDPTPLKAIGLALAAADDWPNVVYIARPCQFRDLSKEQCSSSYWTNKRFSREVIVATGQALDYFVRQVNVKSLELIGYSGGGAIAVLLAAERNDVISLRTVAGNLDHDAVNQYHGVSQMPESLNPINVAEKLKWLPQRHFVGANDKIVPSFITEKFIQKSGSICSDVTYVKSTSHETGWVGRWHALIKLPLRCKP